MSKSNKSTKNVSKKSTKAKAANGAKKSARHRYADDMKITVLSKQNPFREGSERFKAFALLKSGMTVAAFAKKSKALKRILRRATRGGLVKVA